MSAQPMAFYRDPLEKLLADEARTCKGCVQEIETWGRKHCALAGRKYGKRCKRYVERTPAR